MLNFCAPIISVCAFLDSYSGTFYLILKKRKKKVRDLLIRKCYYMEVGSCL